MPTSDARNATLALLAARPPGATVCPSEVARAIYTRVSTGATSSGWRNDMPNVHAAVDELLAEGLVKLSWKGNQLERRVGPYRIGRVSPRER